MTRIGKSTHAASTARSATITEGTSKNMYGFAKTIEGKGAGVPCLTQYSDNWQGKRQKRVDLNVLESRKGEVIGDPVKAHKES